MRDGASILPKLDVLMVIMRRTNISIIDVGWNPIRPIFHERSGSREEHEEHEGKHERITQTNKNDHTYARSEYT